MMDGSPRKDGPDETNDPRNPPNVLLRKETRRAAVGVYLGSVIALFVVVAIALAYWMSRGPAEAEFEQADRDVPRATGTGGETTPGGFDPAPRPDSTREELELRGSSSGADANTTSPDVPYLSTIRDVMRMEPKNAIGRRVELRNVTVESAHGATFWVKDGDARLAVSGMPSQPVTGGQRVNISGTIESDGSGQVRLRASDVESTR